MPHHAPQEKTTYFGDREVAWDEKQDKVNAVFDSVAKHYDRMNDLMSFGLHRLWKRFTVELSALRQGQKVLDLAGGSGDLTRLLAQKVGHEGLVVLSDINRNMLEVGRNRLLNEGILSPVLYTQTNAEALSFKDNSFDVITLAFGLRNVRDQNEALRSMYRILRPGGKLVILEFSKPTWPAFAPLYHAYLFSVVPFLGKIVAKDKTSYQYLAESIERHPAQDVLKSMIQDAGFEDCRYHNLSGGIVALHIAFKY